MRTFFPSAATSSVAISRRPEVSISRSPMTASMGTPSISLRLNSIFIVLSCDAPFPPCKTGARQPDTLIDSREPFTQEATNVLQFGNAPGSSGRFLVLGDPRARRSPALLRGAARAGGEGGLARDPPLGLPGLPRLASGAPARG